MEIFSENTLEASVQKIRKMVEEAIGRLVEQGGKIVNDVREEYMPLFKDFVKNITGELKGIAFGKEVETLNLTTLVEMAKQYKVSGSNEIVALKVKQDDDYYIYLASSKDRQLLPVESNKYIIIKAQVLAEDVEGLFAESELVILK